MDESKKEHLRTLWELFRNSPDGSYERSTRLNVLLAECLILHKNGVDVKAMVSEFTLVSSVTTIICCELLSDVHRMIQNIRSASADNEQPVEEPAVPSVSFKRENSALAKELFESFTDRQLLLQKNTLKNSILKGTAWRILAVIQRLGPEALSCKRQLCGFLIWLCEGLSGEGSECLQFNDHLCPPDNRGPMYNLFKNKIWIKERNKNSKREGENRKRHNKRVGIDRPGTSAQKPSASSDSDNDQELENLGNISGTRIAMNPDGSHSPRTPKSPPWQKIEHREPVENYITDQHKEIMNSEISLFELHMIAVDVLYKLCKHDVIFAEIAPDLSVSFQAANFAFKQLHALEFENPPILQCRLDPTNIFKLKSALTELLIVSVDRTIERNGANFSYLKTYGIPILLRLLNSMIKKIKVLSYLNEQEKLYSSKYLFGVNYVILILIYFSLTRKCDLNIVELLSNNELFGEMENGLVFGYSINLIMKISGNNSEIVDYVKKLLILIMRLITLMKRVRAILAHSISCPLETHKRCKAGLLKLLNHHSRGFGRHYFDTEDEEIVGVCRVTKFFHIFTYLMTNEYFIRNSTLRVKVLKCMKSCGTCCCFPPEHFLESSIKLIKLHNNIAKPCFDTLEYVMYNQLGFIKLDPAKQYQCSQCEKTYKMASQVRVIENDNAQKPDIIYTWPYLTYYTDLLQSDDSALLHATMSHILQVSLICNISMKRDLLFNVLYSSFESGKRHYLATKSENSFFITLSCLRLITNLICSVSTAEEFIRSGKLNGVLQLVHLSEFSKACCSLLEIAIDVEIFDIQCRFFTHLYDGKFEKFTMDAMITALPSLGLLIVCLKKVTDKLLKSFEQQINNQALYAKLTVLKSDTITFLMEGAELDPIPEVSIATSFPGDRMELLKNAYNYWKTCASLCLYCPVLRKYLTRQVIFMDSFKLLKVILHGIYNIKYSEAESRLLIKISESLIVIGLCLSESTMNESKDFTVHLLSEALLSDIKEIDELNMKLLLEMLIRVSSVYINNVQILPDIVKKKLPVFSYAHPDAELYPSSEDEDESKYVCPYLKEDSDQYVTADEGYEADIEVCPVDGSIHHRTRNFSAANKKDVSDVSKLMKMGGMLHDSREVLHTNDVKKNFLVHGEISNVLIDVLMKLIQIIVTKSYGVNDFDEPITSLHKLVCRCINRLTSIFSIEDNCTIVSDLISRILSNPVAKFLKLESPPLEELQRSVLSLIYSIANHCIMPVELKLYLEMFTFTNIPMNILLEPLGKLADEIICNVPDFIVCFPTKKLSEPDNTQLNIEIPGDTLPLEITPDALEKAHISAGIASCWSSTSLWCPMEKVESIWTNGYSASMWIRLQEFQDSPVIPSDLFQFSSGDESDDENIPEWKYKRNRYFKTKFHNHHKFHANPKNQQPDYVPDILHLFSFGQDNVITEFWVNANNGDLHIKNCIPELGSNRVVGDEIIPRLLPLRRWFHFAINVKETILKQTFGFEVTLFVDSVQMSTAIVSLEGIIHKKRRPTYLLLGHSTSKYNENIKFAGSWCISELSIYRSPVLDQNNILYLMAHGPNKLSFQVCQADKFTLDFTPVFSNNLISSQINWDKIIEMSDEDVEDLQNNLLVKFSASNPYHFESHHQSKVKIRVLHGKIPRGMNTVAGTIPSSVICTWVGSALHNQYRGLPVAVYLLGGPQILLHLFARVVELDGSAEEQACALRILLKVSFSDMRLNSAFHKDDILSLVLSVFSSRKCLMSFHLLEAMLGASVNDPVLVNVNSRFHLLTKNYPIILHPEIIVSLVKAWKDLERDYHVVSKTYTLSTEAKMTEAETKSIWVKPRIFAPKTSEPKDIIVDGNKTLLETLLLFLKLLVRDDHPGRVFNIYQLNKVNLVDSLLMSCKERFLNSDFEILNERAIKDLVDVIRSLIGSPPDYRSISCVTDFLTLMHQANLTFVTHSRSSFYFLLSPDLYEPEKKTSNILSLPFMGRKKSKRGSKRKRQGHMISDKGTRQAQRNSAEETNTPVEQDDPTDENTPPQEDIPVEENAQAEKKITAQVHSPQEYLFIKECTSIRDTSAQPLNEDSSFDQPSTSQLSYIAQASTSKDAAISLDISQVSATTVDTVTMQENILIRETSPIRSFNRLKQSTVVKYKRFDQSTPSGTEQHNRENPVSVTSYDTYELSKDYVVVESTEGTPLLTVPTTIKEQLRYIFRSPILRPGCKSSWVICEGLLMLLKDAISIMPDNQLHQVLGKVFNHNILLILSNHKELYVRVGVVKVVAALVQRYFPEDMKKLTDSNYFIHLANQLSLYQASIDLVVACASLIFGHEISLDNIISSLDYVKDDALMRCPPLLALLSCTFHNTSLFKNVVRIIRKIVEKGSIKLLSYVGICEAVLKSLKFLGTNDKNSVGDFDVMLKGCQLILGDVAKKTLSQNINHQLLIDLYNQLMYFELNEKPPFSDQTIEICSIMRETISYIFILEIDFVAEKLQLRETNRDEFQNSVRSVTEIEASQTQYEIFNILVGMTFPDTPRKLVFRATKTELLSRQYSTLMKVCSFLTSREFSIEPSFTEHQLVMKIFSILLPNMQITNLRHSTSRWWNSNKDHLHNVFVNLFYWAVAPGSLKIETQTEILSRVCEEPSLKLLLTSNDPLKQKKLSLYLSILAASINEQNGNCNNLLDLIMDWVLTMELAGDIIITEEVINEAKRLRDFDKEEAKKSINFSSIERSVFVKNFMAVSLMESAMSITRTVVEIQNFERKEFLKHLRRQQNSLVMCMQKWREIVDKYCHEKGAWYSQEAYPNSWELNPTEGPDRIRIRLRRCNLDIDERFFNPAKRERRRFLGISKPLEYLFDSLHSCVQGGLIERLHMNENVCFMSRATYVTVKHEQTGELLLSDRCIHFLPDIGDDHQSITGAYWPLIDIINVSTRRWQLKERAVEVFLSSGHAHLIAFASFSEMRAFLNSLDNCHLPNRVPSDSLSDIINQWRNGNLSNWAYLMKLNSKAGRTYNDLMQYPVFPFILSDYTSLILDLTDPKSYRNLHKPMAIQNKENEIHYINNYNYLKEARNESGGLTGFNREPYHYGSHYSNSGTVLHFMVRLSPFTQLFLKYQDNNFDIPDRTFHSLQTTWRLSSRDSNTDVKELIPEFFYLSPMLCNSEDLAFGVRQNGVQVHDVELPTWAKNARLMMLIHRQALESSFVKENLPNWIDLVFGYKQTGQPAIDAVNVFHPATYYGFDPSVIKDQLEKNAWETMVRTYGQTPRQLLKQPHPQYITNFQHAPDNVIRVLPNVKGLRWGSYCGSPEEPQPSIAWRRHNRVVPLQGVISLKTNEVFGVAGGSTIIPLFEKKDNEWRIPVVNLILWGYPDGIIRIKYKDEPPKPLIKIPDLDPLCAVSQGYGETSSTLWLGLQSGRIIVLIASAFNTLVPSITFSRKPINLYGHNSPIVDISVCVPFGVTASASEDGVVNIWDLHNFTFIRTIDNNIPTVSKVCISQTLGDVATVHLMTYDSPGKSDVAQQKQNEFGESSSAKASTSDNQSSSNEENKTQKRSLTKYRSKISVRTINGVLVGQVSVVEKVCCLCYSNAPEGISVNVIAAGLETGAIRLFSSWDLKPLILMTPNSPTHPIISMAYSENSQHLYVCASDGAIILWEIQNNRQDKSAFRVFSPKNLLMIPL